MISSFTNNMYKNLFRVKYLLYVHYQKIFNFRFTFVENVFSYRPGDGSTNNHFIEFSNENLEIVKS